MSVRRALTAAAVAGGAALAVAVPAAMAQASTGVFIYHNRDGRQFLVDQPSYQCTQTPAFPATGPLINDTDSIALVYLTPECTGPVQIIVPGEETWPQPPFFGSVMFVND